jgi:hypothetical protein
MVAPNAIRNLIENMKFLDQSIAVLGDSHFLIPLVVLCVGLALLVYLH